MMETGAHYDLCYLHNLTTEELVDMINDSPCWDDDLNRELCDRAGIVEEWDAADADDAEEIIYKAADILGVEI